MIAKFRGMGADTVISNEKLNHRFRGSVITENNEKLFIEFHLVEVHKYSIDELKRLANEGEYIIGINHAFREEFEKRSYDPEFSYLEKTYIKASREDLISFLKNNINEKYEDFVIIDELPCSPNELFKIA